MRRRAPSIHERSVRARSPLALLFLCVTSACASAGPIERKTDGVVWSGRPVSSEAYAWYARGLHHEARGEGEEARYSFEQATSADPKSGSAWAALGRLQCADDLERAQLIFSTGREHAQEQLPLLLERAACLLHHEQPQRALRDAQEALQRAPRSGEVTALLEEIWLALGDPIRARQTRLAFTQFVPEHAAARRSELAQGEAPPSFLELDRAITQGALSLSRGRAIGLLSPGELALRCFALGQTELARAQAELVLATDPDQADAALTLILLEEPADSHVELTTTPGAMLAAFDDLSSLGLLLYARHLSRAVGSREAQLFLERAPPLELRSALEHTLALELRLPTAPTRGVY